MSDIVTPTARTRMAKLRTDAEQAVVQLNADYPHMMIKVWRIALAIDDRNWKWRLEVFLIASHCDYAEQIDSAIWELLGPLGWDSREVLVHVS